MKKFLYLGGASLVMASAPAVAQDAAPASGFKVGGLIGIDSVEAEVDGFSGSEEDIVYGATLGYDWVSAGGTVLGLEAEYSESGVGVNETDVVDAGDEATLNAGRDLYVGARVGYAVGSAVFYAKGGYTNLKLNATYDDGIQEITGSDEIDGFRLGAGAEFAVGSNIAIRAEYRYSDYGSYDVIGTPISFSRHQGVVGLLARF